MYLLAPYNTSFVARFPLVKRAVVDLAVKADYTPANGDVNISKDGGAQANPANNLNIVTGTTWNVTLSAAEMTAKEIIVMVRNNTAVEDQWLCIKTFGNTNAFYGGDITANNITVDLRAIVAAAVSGPATAGVLDVNIKNVNNVVANTNLVVDLRQIVGGAVSGPATAGVLDVNIKNVNNAVFNANLAQFGASVISLAANSITTGVFNANAIDGRVVANNVTVSAVSGNVGNVTGNIGGSLAGSVGSVTGNVTVGTIANNAVTEVAFDQTAGSFNPLGVVDQGIAQNTSATSIKIRSAAPFNANEIVGATVVVSTGTGRGQARSILSYNNANNTAQVDTWTTTPNSNAAYKIFAGPPAPATPPQVQVVDITANALKEFFNTNTTTNYASSVAGSVVKEIADNAVGSAGTSPDSILARFNSNLVLGNQTFTLTGSVTGNVGNVTSNVGGSVAGSVGSVTNNVTVGTIANNAITAVVLNANAITGSKVGNDVDVRNVSGNVSGSVGSVTANVTVQTIANNAITAVSINANAITGAKVGNDVDIRNVNGNVTGTVGSVTGNVGNVTGNLGGTVASIINLNAQLVDAKISGASTPAQVKTQVVAALTTDTYAEPGQGTPNSTLDLATKLGYLFKFARNKITQTNNTLSIFSADAVTVDQKSTVSDDGTTYTRSNVVTGP